MNQYAAKMKDPNYIQETSDTPTETFVTTRAIIFYISSILAIVCMFLNWLPLDIELGLARFSDVLGTINAFTLIGAMSDLKESVGILSYWLPDELTSGFSLVSVVGGILFIAGIAAIVLYAYSMLLRLKEDDRCVRIGKLAALVAVGISVGFMLLVMSCVLAMDMSDALGQVMGDVLTGPCMLTLICALVSGYCAVRDMQYKEDVVIYYNGLLKIDNGPKWRCDSCHRSNLSRLEKCYYCGIKKK